MRLVKMIVFCVLAVFAVQCFLSVPAVAAEKNTRQKMKGVLRPNAEEGPTKVQVGFYVIDISNISDADQSFTADIYVTVQWEDPRMAGEGRRVRKVDELSWHPELMLLNRREGTTRYDDIVTVDPNGTVTYQQRLYGEYSFPLDLRNFPFDDHRIPFEFITAGQGPDEVELVVDDKVVGRKQGLSIADWAVGDVDVSLDAYHFEPQDTYFNLMTFTLDAHRQAGFYIWRIIAPLVLIVFMSWMVFWIDPSHLEAQVGISATSILTLIAFQFTVGILLPRIAYLTRMDMFIFFSSILVFLALVEGVTTSALASKGKRELALKFDAWSRFLFPAAFITSILVSFVF